jgi:hypothetical protein
MPISKKDRVCDHCHAHDHTQQLTFLQIQREHKKADKAGTRAPVKANGLPVKAPKPTSIVRNHVTRICALFHTTGHEVAGTVRG